MIAAANVPTPEPTPEPTPAPSPPRPEPIPDGDDVTPEPAPRPDPNDARAAEIADAMEALAVSAEAIEEAAQSLWDAT